MVTKFMNLSWLYDFFAMETKVVLTNFTKKYKFVSTFFLSVKNDCIQFLLLPWLQNSRI